MTSITYPNGQVLTSTAMSPSQVSIIIQALTCGLLGINPVNNALVRVDWQFQGQPFESISEDICYVGCLTKDVEYSRVRDRTFSGVDGPVTETWVYTRGWDVAWTFYGPNATDRARAVRSAFFLDYANDVLSLQNLFSVNDPSEALRIPELINAEWFERCDFRITMYEQVTETITDGQALSLEVKVYDGSSSDPVADITVRA